MGTIYSAITDEQVALIEATPLFFVSTVDPGMNATADGIGPINLSPKGGTPLHVLDRNRVAYLDYTGSGDETARHTQAGGPITIMVCSFEEDDCAIVKLYGKAKITPLEESPMIKFFREEPAGELKLPERQVVEIAVESTVTSCGYGVPVMAFTRERTIGDRGRKFKEKR
jgi:hypothetical protein